MSETPAPRELVASPGQTLVRMGGLFGLAMGLVLGLFGLVMGALAGLPLGPCALVTGIFGGLFGAIVGGGVSGLFFGGMMAAFVAGMRKSPPALPDDTLVFGPANHQRGLEGVGGHLILTRSELRFVPHGFNVQREPASWSLVEVVERRKAKSLGLLENRLVLTLVGGAEAAFVVEEPDTWIAALDEAQGSRLALEAARRSP